MVEDCDVLSVWDVVLNCSVMVEDCASVYVMWCVERFSDGRGLCLGVCDVVC